MTSLLKVSNEVNSRLISQATVKQGMPATLIRIVQNHFNKSFWQVFTSHLTIIFPHFDKIIRTLTKGNFHPGTITMPGGFRHTSMPAPTTSRSIVSAPLTLHPHLSSGGGGSTNHTQQVSVQNPAPIAHLKVGIGFCLRKSMDMYTETTG